MSGRRCSQDRNEEEHRLVTRANKEDDLSTTKGREGSLCVFEDKENESSE